MWLEYWMIAILVAFFALAIVANYRRGVFDGSMATMEILVEQNIIKVEDGDIVGISTNKSRRTNNGRKSIK